MLGFGFLAALIAFVGYRGISGMTELNAMLNTTYHRDMLGLSAAKETNINLISIGREMRAAILAEDSSNRAAAPKPRAKSVRPAQKTPAPASRDSLSRLANHVATVPAHAESFEEY